jgi:hypothetical protein
MLVRFFRFSLLVVAVLALLDDVLVDARLLFSFSVFLFK